MRGSASFTGSAAGGIVALGVLGGIVTSVFILNSSYRRQMLCGPDSQLGAAPHAPVGVFLRFDVVKIFTSHDPPDGASPVPWPLAPSGGIRLGGVPDQACW
jgi:hypothetical protein